MPHSSTTHPTVLDRGGVGWCGLRRKQSTRALAFGRKWSTCVLQFASNNRNSYALAFARVLSIVFAGAHSPAPLLHQQLRDELLDAVDARLLEFPAFEVLCLSQVGVIDELVHTMARLRGGLPSQAPAAAASSTDEVLDQRGRFEAVFAMSFGSALGSLVAKAQLPAQHKQTELARPSETGLQDLSNCDTCCLPQGGCLPPGIGARGFLCNIKLKGLYGLRGVVASVDGTRAGVRIDETGKLVSIPRANLVYDADYPACRLKSFASGPPGLPGFLQELVFVVSHPGGLRIRAAPRSCAPTWSSGPTPQCTCRSLPRVAALGCLASSTR